MSFLAIGGVSGSREFARSTDYRSALVNNTGKRTSSLQREIGIVRRCRFRFVTTYWSDDIKNKPKLTQTSENVVDCDNVLKCVFDESGVMIAVRTAYTGLAARQRALPDYQLSDRISELGTTHLSSLILLPVFQNVLILLKWLRFTLHELTVVTPHMVTE